MKKPYTVLICDDDKFLLEMYQKKFDKYGVRSTLCAEPSMALSRLRAGEKFDILLLDIIMPEMDGLELLRTIRKEKLVEDAVVIMLTNESSSSKIEEAKGLNVAGYIVKATSIPSEVVEEVIKIADSQS